MSLYDKLLIDSDFYKSIIKTHAKILSNTQIILDSGAGTEALALELLKLGKTIHAVELNEPTLNKLKNRCERWKNNLYTYNSDTELLSSFTNNFFDAANSLFVFQFLNNPKIYFNEIYRILKCGGVFVLSYRNKQEPTDLKKKFYNSIEDSLKRNGLMKYTEYRLLLKKFKHTREQIIALIKNTCSDEKIENMLINASFSRMSIIEHPTFG